MSRGLCACLYIVSNTLMGIIRVVMYFIVRHRWLTYWMRIILSAYIQRACARVFDILRVVCRRRRRRRVSLVCVCGIVIVSVMHTQTTTTIIIIIIILLHYCLLCKLRRTYLFSVFFFAYPPYDMRSHVCTSVRVTDNPNRLKKTYFEGNCVL
jgi:hypothetical protein